MKLVFFTVLYFLVSIQSFCQEDIAELKQKLQSTPQDTTAVHLLNDLSASHLLSNTDSALYFANRALSLTMNIEYRKGEAIARRRLTQAYINSGSYERAKTEALSALDLFNQLNELKEKGGVLNQIGAIEMYQGNYKAASDKLYQALEVLENLDDKVGQASTYNALGNIAQKQGRYLEAAEYLHKALDLYQKLENMGGVADALNNIGVVYEYQEEYEKALDNYQKSYELYQEVGDKIGVAIGLHNAGIILKKTGNYDSAIYNFNAALRLDTEIGAIDGVAYDKKELGETYYFMNRLDVAYENLHDALKLAISLEDPVLSVPTLVLLGNVHSKLNNFDSALFYLKQGFEKADKTQLQNEKKEAAKSLFELYDQQQNVEKSYEYYKVYNQIKDTLFNEENIRKLTLLEAQYGFEKSRGEDELKRKLIDLEKDSQIANAIWLRNSSIVGFIMISIMAFLIYLNYRRKRLVNESLNKLNQEINIQKDELSVQTQELHELNEKLQLLNNTLEQKVADRTSQLETKNKQLENKNLKLADYAFYNAHKLRAPLANVMGLTNLFIRPEIDSKEKEFIANKIITSSNELNSVVVEMQQILKER